MPEMSEKLRSKLVERGINPDTFMQNLSRYVGNEGQAFSNLEGYARAIQQKQNTGQPLQDPETARQFMSLFPQAGSGQQTQTTFQYPVNTGVALPRNTPGASLMQAVLQYQRNNPITIPYAPGTPTQRRVEAEEAARQYEQNLLYQKERDALMDERWREQFEYQKQQDAIANALRRAALRSGGGGTTQQQRLSTIMQDAVNLTRYLMDRPVQGEYVSALGRRISGHSDVGTAVPYSRVTPKEAAEQTIGIVLSQIGDLGISKKEFEDVVEMVYRAAGVPTKEQRPKEMWEDEFYRRRIAAGDYASGDNAAIRDLLMYFRGGGG